MTTLPSLVERIAREADPDFGNEDGDMADSLIGLDAITRFAQLVAAECVTLAEQTYEGTEGGGDDCSGTAIYGERTADAIRERFGLKGE